MTRYERMMAKLGRRAQQAAASIASVFSPAPIRRMETKQALDQFLQAPANPEFADWMSVGGHDRLKQWAIETYGESGARHILPYLEAAQPEEGLSPLEGGRGEPSL